MIHRFIDLLGRLPDIPILGFDASPLSTRTLWQIGNRATPYRMIQPIVTSLGTPQTHLGDPQREPVAGASVVYSRFTTTGTLVAAVRLVDWDDTTDVELYTETGLSRSLQPTWKPDGSKILFRSKGVGSLVNVIKHMDPDGTGVTTLYTGSVEVHNPLYNFDGSKIAWVEGQTVMVANADGTGATAEFTATGITVLGQTVAWQHAASVLAFRHDGGTFSSVEEWKKMNDDGTALATWLTISRASGYGPGDGDPAPIMYSWRLDDSAIVTTVRQLADPDPDARLTQVDGSGSNLISPAVYGASNAGSPDTRPVVLAGRLEGVERIFILGGVGVPVASILPDGSDYRVDFDGTGTPGGSSFHGFRGDTVNV